MVNKEDYDSYDGYVDALVERITTLQAENAKLKAELEAIIKAAPHDAGCAYGMDMLDRGCICWKSREDICTQLSN